MEITLSLKALNSPMDVEADYEGKKKTKSEMEGVIPGCQSPPALVYLGAANRSADTQVKSSKKGLGV